MVAALMEQLQGYSAKVLAVALLAAALAKLAKPAAFKSTVRMLGVGRFAAAVAFAVPAAEAVLGMGFALPVLRVYVEVAATLLFAVFAGVALQAIRAGKRVRCSCFGNSESRLGWQTVVSNAVLIMLVWLAARRPVAPAGVLAEIRMWLGAAALVTMAAIVGHVMSSWKNLEVPASD